ncbi:hypothetical protein MPTK1_6g07300 [Marchantia polymorpha subsp. ruderalis]|uniref:Uncharacterized protein n=2 Tax=Marchantia polymorpha TaxID=3197 RepID=A0AAF6BPG7_MARPO|nr:hypothetical protein MARPO_0053s0044 [Marchantia polymorpha]BBN13901.1 hypothetical protein Mp_6g07300 [Marchantia polymorpha subsp. ruderalis]PTQ38103.1 hypothetical protein MARPO_0053s0044 [Marchantia polymorpha]PTQ38104.1 hypothetical protein MARPO_0053s0044 [Marchantia polymorpha]BBN13902.1 hypothetical protein Mp_6g07300 [Marchantia polymorpha subsp. ruderalis]|eukprot:PTQ38102.1 hypothetical protein MARPO_0053s0044 [Marchantia polymorpha]
MLWRQEEGCLQKIQQNESQTSLSRCLYDSSNGTIYTSALYLKPKLSFGFLTSSCITSNLVKKMLVDTSGTTML